MKLTRREMFKRLGIGTALAVVGGVAAKAGVSTFNRRQGYLAFDSEGAPAIMTAAEMQRQHAEFNRMINTQLRAAEKMADPPPLNYPR